MRTLLKKVGNFVKAGDIIAIAGPKNGRWSWISVFTLNCGMGKSS